MGTAWPACMGVPIRRMGVPTDCVFLAWGMCTELLWSPGMGSGDMVMRKGLLTLDTPQL